MTMTTALALLSLSLLVGLWENRRQDDRVRRKVNAHRERGMARERMVAAATRMRDADALALARREVERQGHDH